MATKSLVDAAEMMFPVGGGRAGQQMDFWMRHASIFWIIASILGAYVELQQRGMLPSTPQIKLRATTASGRRHLAKMVSSMWSFNVPMPGIPCVTLS